MNTNLNMRTMPIEMLKPAKYNPRKDLKPGDPAYEKIKRSLHDFGISLPPALLTMLGVCGVRIAWIQGVFPQSRTFKTIMTAYPISLSTTALLVLTALLYYHPSRRIESARA